MSTPLNGCALHTSDAPARTKIVVLKADPIDRTRDSGLAHAIYLINLLQYFCLKTETATVDVMAQEQASASIHKFIQIEEQLPTHEPGMQS